MLFLNWVRADERNDTSIRLCKGRAKGQKHQTRLKTQTPLNGKEKRKRRPVASAGTHGGGPEGRRKRGTRSERRQGSESAQAAPARGKGTRSNKNARFAQQRHWNSGVCAGSVDRSGPEGVRPDGRVVLGIARFKGGATRPRVPLQGSPRPRAQVCTPKLQGGPWGAEKHPQAPGEVVPSRLTPGGKSFGWCLTVLSHRGPCTWDPVGRI